MTGNTTIINHTKYIVSYVFNMVGNFYFTNKEGIHHLVDAEDVAIWADEQGIGYQGIKTAIAYAKDIAGDDGMFWWTVKTGEKQKILNF
jgi:hypothetical protein